MLDQLFLAAFMLFQLLKPSYSLVNPRFPQKPSVSSEPSEHLVNHRWLSYLDRGQAMLPRTTMQELVMISILTIGLWSSTMIWKKWPSATDFQQGFGKVTLGPPTALHRCFHEGLWPIVKGLIRTSLFFSKHFEGHTLSLRAPPSRTLKELMNELKQI